MARSKHSVLIKTRHGEFRWETYAANNRTIGGSTESFKNKQDCINNAQMNGVFRLKDQTQ